jgi:DNA-binding GntR family transcriptional regulator
LQEQGLVVNHARRGMFVFDLEPEDIQKINGVRLLLEAECLRLARTNLTTQSEAKLVQVLDRLERSESASPNIRARLDFDFHRAVWAIAGNKYLERTLTSLSGPVFAHSVLRIMKSDKIRHIIYSHRPLLSFIQGNSKVTAETTMSDHLKVPWTQTES